MSFCKEDVKLDYHLFVGAATYLLKLIEADPAGGTSCISKFESCFVQKGHPSYRDTWKHAQWLLKMTQRCCFSVTSFLGALIYLERLRHLGKVSLYESTWRSIWVAISVISEKRWEDNYIHPGHVHNTYGSSHTTEEQQKMQLKLFEALGFNLAIELDEFTGWLNMLRSCEKDQQILMACQFQRVFLPRPIPNLKTKKPQNTPSTSANSLANSESESESSERNYPRQSIAQKYDAQKRDLRKLNHLLSQAQPGYSLSQTPRANGEGQAMRHMTHHGAATCRRDYYAKLSSDSMPQSVPELRPGARARDHPGTQANDYSSYSQLDPQSSELNYRMQELTHRMQQLNHQRGADRLRTSCWQTAEHQQQGMYQQTHRLASQRMGTSMFDHANPMASWTARVPQYDVNYPRSNFVAWS
jgi:hypothetical protein